MALLPLPRLSLGEVGVELLEAEARYVTVSNGRIHPCEQESTHFCIFASICGAEASYVTVSNGRVHPCEQESTHFCISACICGAEARYAMGIRASVLRRGMRWVFEYLYLRRAFELEADPKP